MTVAPLAVPRKMVSKMAYMRGGGHVRHSKLGAPSVAIEDCLRRGTLRKFARMCGVLGFRNDCYGAMRAVTMDMMRRVGKDANEARIHGGRRTITQSDVLFAFALNGIRFAGDAVSPRRKKSSSAGKKEKEAALA